jgi:hypothetical protein
MTTNFIRPRSVTMMLWVVFLLGGWNGGRVIALSLNRRTLETFNTIPSPGVRMGLAIVWAILFWTAAIALWGKRPFTRYVIPALLAFYGLLELGLLLLYAQSPSARNSWLTNLLFYGGLALYSLWGLNRTAVKPYYQRKINR